MQLAKLAARSSTPSWELEGKPVIVTGASSGVGAATAVALGAVGAPVMLVGRDEGRLEECAKEANAGGTPVECAVVDLTDPEAAAQLAAHTVETFGSLHGVVHCAGITDAGRLDDDPFDFMGRQWRTNLLAPIMLTQAAVPHLEHGSSIVLVGSTVGRVGFAGMADYASTKGAVRALTRALAVELAPRGIRVNIVQPGYVQTPMIQSDLDTKPEYVQWILDRTPLGRIGQPAELAAAIVFLLSGLSAYVNGTALVADGGWTAQ